MLDVSSSCVRKVFQSTQALQITYRCCAFEFRHFGRCSVQKIFVNGSVMVLPSPASVHSPFTVLEGVCNGVCAQAMCLLQHDIEPYELCRPSMLGNNSQ